MVAYQSPNVELLADFGLGLSKQLLVFSCLRSIEAAAKAVEAHVTPWFDLRTGSFAYFLIICAGLLSIQTDHEDDLDCVLLERVHCSRADEYQTI